VSGAGPNLQLVPAALRSRLRVRACRLDCETPDSYE